MQIDTAQARAMAKELEDELSEVSAEARDAVLRSLEDGRELLAARSVDSDAAWAYARMGGWQVIRGLIALVAFIPRLVVRALGGLSDVVDELAGRGIDVRGRGRDLAAAIPGAGRRQSSRRRNVLLVAFGVVIGFVGGIAVSRRRAPIVTYDVPPLPPVDDATPIDPDPLADVATPSDTEAPDGDGDDGTS